MAILSQYYHNTIDFFLILCYYGKSVVVYQFNPCLGTSVALQERRSTYELESFRRKEASKKRSEVVYLECFLGLPLSRSGTFWGCTFSSPSRIPVRVREIPLDRDDRNRCWSCPLGCRQPRLDHQLQTLMHRTQKPQRIAPRLFSFSRHYPTTILTILPGI